MVTKPDPWRLSLEDGSDSLSERVVTALQRRILLGEIPLGSWLRHGKLADEFGISRTPVREALRILAAQGIVTISRNKGAHVNGQSRRSIREIGEVRAELEGFAAALAADRIDDQQVERLTEAWREFRNRAEGLDGDLAELWIESNEEFHSAVLDASGNEQLSVTIGELRRRLPHNISYGAYAGNSRLIARNLDEHEAIAQAIIGQDADLARRLMAEHIRASIDATVRWVERVAVGTPRR